MTGLMRLMPLIAGLATSQARHRVRDVKFGLFVTLALAVGVATAYICVMLAIVTALIPPLGLVGAFLATGAGALALAMIIAFAFKLYRNSVARKWRRSEESFSRIASTGLALLPLLARHYTKSNPKLALAAAGILGLVLANLTSGKSRD
jgi:hypothetical protein